jgi:hypothetical protein
MRPQQLFREWRGVLMLALLVALGLAAIGIARVTTPAPAASPAAADPDARRAVPLPGGKDSDSDLVRQAAQAWADRYTYPTGQYDPAWVRAAAAQDRRIARAVPAGQVIYSREQSASPLALDPQRFLSLGPQPLDTTNQAGYKFGHVSGRANALAINPTNPAIAYLGTAGGGVWRTTNCCSAQTTWALTSDDPLINTTAITSLAVDPNNPNLVYAGTGDLEYSLLVDLGGSQGILKSADGGTTWSTVGAATFGIIVRPAWSGEFFKQAVGKVAVDPRNSQNIVAGTRNGLYFSYDTGATWSGPCFTNAFADRQAQPITGLILTRDGATTRVYAAVGVDEATVDGANGVYRATLPASGCPAVADWTLLNAGWPTGTGGGTAAPTLPGRIDLAIAPSNPLVLYAQAESFTNPAPNGRGQLGVWRTTDGGATWTQRSNATALRDCNNASGDYNQNGYDQGLAVDPNNPDVLFMDTFEIWKSTDAGATFSNLTCIYSGADTVKVHADQHSLLFAPGSSSVLLAANDGGVNLTTDATAPAPAFVTLNDSINTIEYYSGDITGNFATAAQIGAIGGAQDNGISVYTGPAQGPRQWVGTSSGDGFFARVDGRTASATGGTWFAGLNSGSWERSTTGPNGPYVRPQNPEPWAAETKAFALPFDIQRGDCAPSGCTHLIAGSFHVWETTDQGSTWYNAGPALTKGPTGYINQLSYARGNATLAIAGTSDGNAAFGSGLGAGGAGAWVALDGGNAVLPNRPILDVTLNAADPRIGYAAVGGFNATTPTTPGHVFQLTCATLTCASFTWTDKTGNLPDIPADAVIANPLYPQQVFVGSDWGLYFTNDITANPPTWLRFQAGLPNVQIGDLLVDEGNTTLAAWTRARGAYVWPLPSGPFTPPTPGGPTPTPVPTATAPACAVTFSDVNPTDYFYTPVQYLACHGAISGYGDGTFRPYNFTTRGQLAKIIVGAEGWTIDTTGGPHFNDVPADNPFYPFIETAFNHGVISGYADGDFRWGANVTRGQLSKIIVTAARWAIDTTGGPHFSDVPADNPFYPFIETAFNHHIISGYADGTFGWGADATRGQISKIVYLSLPQP